jgi:Secretion system C-terminal sorting domain
VGTYGRGIWEVNLVTSPIPVRWISFTGKRAASGNQLSWKVEENSITDKYELEYSSNGVRFSTVATIDAKAKILNSNGLTAEYVQAHPATGDAYYRLKQFDKNGRFYYSDIVFLKDQQKEQLVVFPNPVQDRLSISIPGTLGNTGAIVQIYNTGGILLLQQTESDNTSSINTSRFSSGQYILRVIVGEKVYQQVFLKGK